MHFPFILFIAQQQKGAHREKKTKNEKLGREEKGFWRVNFCVLFACS